MFAPLIWGILGIHADTIIPISDAAGNNFYPNALEPRVDNNIALSNELSWPDSNTDSGYPYTLNYFFGNADGIGMLYQFHDNPGQFVSTKCSLRAFTLPSSVKAYHNAYLLEEAWSKNFSQGLGTTNGPYIYHPFILGFEKNLNRSLGVINWINPRSPAGPTYFQVVETVSGQVFSTTYGEDSSSNQWGSIVDFRSTAQGGGIYVMYTTVICCFNVSVWIHRFSLDGQVTLKSPIFLLNETSWTLYQSDSYSQGKLVRVNLPSAPAACSQLLIFVSHLPQVPALPVIRALDTATMQQCWEYSTPYADGGVFGSRMRLLVDENRSFLYLLGQWQVAGDWEILCFSISSNALTLLNRLPLNIDPFYTWDLGLAMDPTSDLLAVSARNYDKFQNLVIRACTSVSSCSLTLVRSLPANGYMQMLTSNWLYVARDNAVQVWNIKTGAQGWTWFPPSTTVDRVVVMGEGGPVIVLTSSQKAFILSSPPAALPVPLSARAIASEVLSYIKYALTILAYIVKFYYFKTAKKGENSFSRLDENRGKCKKYCCNELRDRRPIVALAVLSWILQIPLAGIAIAEVNSAIENVKQTTDPLNIESLAQFRNNYLINCTNPKEPYDPLAFCFSYPENQCSAISCKRTSENVTFLGQNMCSCDASFYPFSCDCDYSSDTCNKTQMRFNKNIFLPSVTTTFSSCVDAYENSINELQKSIWLNVVITVITLALTHTSIAQIPVGLLSLSGSIAGYVLLSDIVESPVCTKPGGLLSAALPGCEWAATNEFPYIEAASVDSLKNAKVVATSLCNFGIAGTAFWVLVGLPFC